MSHDPELIREIVAKSRAEQGLPPTIEDPVALAKIARLLDLGRPPQS